MNPKSLIQSEIDFLVLMAVESVGPDEHLPYISVCHRLIKLLEETGGLVIDKPEESKPYDPRDFLLFWVHFPKKVGRKEAEEKFRRMIENGNKPHDILRALKRYRQALEANPSTVKFRHASQFLDEWLFWS